MADVLRQAGFRGQSLALARAIMGAESHGRATAHNPNAATGDDSYGLFQINMLGAMGPERRARYGLKSNDDLYNPLVNAKIAYQMSKGGTDWSPWSTYKSGAYKSYLGKGGAVSVDSVTGRQSGKAMIPGLPGANGGLPDTRNALLSMVMGNLQSYANTGQTNSDPMQLQNLLSQYQAANAPSTLPLAPGKLAKKAVTMRQVPPLGGTHGITTIPGTSYQANAQILPQVQSIQQNFGVKVNSAYRDPTHNKSVGGAPHSDHLSGNAIDFVGTPAQMRKLYQWAQGKFPYVEPWDQAGGNHVHISFIR